MSYHELHERAERLARERGLTHEEACAELGRRGVRRRRRVYGVLHPTRADRTAFAGVESPARPYWWQKLDDL